MAFRGGISTSIVWWLVLCTQTSVLMACWSTLIVLFRFCFLFYNNTYFYTFVVSMITTIRDIDDQILQFRHIKSWLTIVSKVVTLVLLPIWHNLNPPTLTLIGGHIMQAPQRPNLTKLSFFLSLKQATRCSHALLSPFHQGFFCIENGEAAASVKFHAAYTSRTHM